MAGTIRRKLDQDLDVGGDHQLVAAEGFKNLFDMCEAHPGLTRIALGYGTGGSGTDHHDGASPFGDQAFAVYRWDTNAGRDWAWYMIIVKGNDSGSASLDFRPRGNNPTSSYGYVCVNAAVGIGGDANPWQGTTDNDGTDTLPAGDWWDSPSAGTNRKVVPASNSTSGTGSGENQNEVINVLYVTSSDNTVRANFWMDDDAFWWATDNDSDGGWATMGIIGKPEVPNPNLSHPNPLFALQFGGAGTVGPSFTDYDVGFTHLDDAESLWESVDCDLEVYPFGDEVGNGTHEMTGTRDAQAWAIVSVTTGSQGLMGFMTRIRFVYGLSPGDTETSLDYVVFGSGSNGNWLFDWDGTTTPGTTASRDGVDSTS